jgi:hypothetical protein
VAPHALRVGGLLTACVSVMAMTAASPQRPASAGSVFTVPQALAGPSVTAPASANLGSAKPGAATTVQLANVTVPNSGVNTWTATVSASNLTTGTGTAAETINNGQLSYWSGMVVSKTGLGTFTPGQRNASEAVPLETPRTAFGYSGFSTATSVTWRPRLQVSVPSTAVAGSYTGTLTHSVA